MNAFTETQRGERIEAVLALAATRQPGGDHRPLVGFAH